MTPNQLPPLPDGVTLEDLLIPLRVALETCHDSDWSLRQFKTPISHALAALAQQAQECTRSHPHELMSPMCGLRTEIARLTNENERFKRAQQAQPVQADAQRSCPDACITPEKCCNFGCQKVTPPAPQVPAPVDEQMTPSFAQLKQILDSLDRCHHRDSKAEFLRTWIRDWSENKVSRAILALRPAVEPMTLEQREVLAALVVGACEHKTRTLLALRAIEATEAQYGIGITAKAEDAHQPTKEAGKP